MQSSTLRRLFVVPALALTLFVTGCDKTPSGVYTTEGPIAMSIEFKSGKAIFSINGQKVDESTFTMDGDKIKIDKDPVGKASSFTVNSDGSITSSDGIK